MLLSQIKHPFSYYRKALSAAVVTVAIVVLSQSSFAAGNSLLEVSEPFAAPQFELKDIDENTVKLSDYLGKPLIVIFWASWCPPCLAETPSINRAWRKIKDEGIGLVAINAGEDYDAVFGFSAEMGTEFPLLVDTTNSTYNEWNVRGLPAAFVLNAQGKVVYKAIGERDWDDEGLLAKVRALRL